jgi:ribosomal protein S18 acetylase RimI-like enzyme
MINYQTDLQNIQPNDLKGFFVGWKKSPNSAKLWEILNNSQFKVLAISNIENELKVVGFVTALSDQVLTVYISLLEVLPAFQKMGIGKVLMSKMLELTKNFYMIDLVCDENLSDFYTKFAMKKQIAMTKRNYKAQNGKTKQ